MKALPLNSDKGCTSALCFELLKPCPFPGWHSLSISLRKYFLMGNICLLPWRALCYQIISGNKKNSFHNGNCFLYFLYIYFCTLIISYLRSEKKVRKEDNLWTKHGQNMDKIWTLYQSRKADFIKTPLLSLASVTPHILIQFNDEHPCASQLVIQKRPTGNTNRSVKAFIFSYTKLEFDTLTN